MLRVPYALLRNGMWDDAAVATSEPVFGHFRALSTKEHFSSERVAPYFTWRFSSLSCGCAFYIVKILLGYPGSVVPDVEDSAYKDYLLNQLPQEIDASLFDDLLRFLMYEDIVFWFITIISFCAIVFATALSWMAPITSFCGLCVLCGGDENTIKVIRPSTSSSTAGGDGPPGGDGPHLLQQQVAYNYQLQPAGVVPPHEIRIGSKNAQHVAAPGGPMVVNLTEYSYSTSQTRNTLPLRDTGQGTRPNPAGKNNNNDTSRIPPPTVAGKSRGSTAENSVSPRHHRFSEGDHSMAASDDPRVPSPARSPQQVAFQARKSVSHIEELENSPVVQALKLRLQTSRRAVAFAWLIAFAPPFLFFLIYPIRSAVDWDAIAADVCHTSVKMVFNMPGTDLRRTLKLTNEAGLLPSSHTLLATGDLEGWCTQHGKDWHQAFYSNAVRCAWVIEDKCRNKYCSAGSGRAAPPSREVPRCLLECLDYAIEKDGVASVRRQTIHGYGTCASRSTPISLGIRPNNIQLAGSRRELLPATGGSTEEDRRIGGADFFTASTEGDLKLNEKEVAANVPVPQNDDTVDRVSSSMLSLTSPVTTKMRSFGDNHASKKITSGSTPVSSSHQNLLAHRNLETFSEGLLRTEEQYSIEASPWSEVDAVPVEATAEQETEPRSLTTAAAVTSAYLARVMAEFYDVFIYTNRQMILSGSEAATYGALQAEYAVGLLVAIVSSRILVTSALSLLGGLAEALLNQKAMFPVSQHGGWVLILTLCEALPIYAALLAMLQQLIGDYIFSVACLLFLVYLSTGIGTGWRLLRLRFEGDRERDRMYRWIWIDYGAKFVCGIAIVITLISWTESNGLTGLQSFAFDTLLDPLTIFTLVVDIVAKKILTAVAGTDLILYAYTRTELWVLEAHDREVSGKAEWRAEVEDMGTLLGSRMKNNFDTMQSQS
ncbi:unnamed protein product [Amoebophrya sp. A25]|nr:unnamed protein product [Amoebophrya sp. A25]|eukprot:GSA25T00000920001.1